MLRRLKVIGAVVALAALSAQAPPSPYAEGQVWHYKTRVGDEDSLLKIQKIEAAPGANTDRIYHISVVGFHFKNSTIAPMLPHAPVSRATLDASVTTLAQTDRSFPPADPGIAEWRAAHGGYFTITVAEIIDVLDQQMSNVPQR
jgi:hypothetical protein